MNARYGIDSLCAFDCPRSACRCVGSGRRRRGRRHGAALYAFCGAQLRRGIEIVTDALHLEACLADADLVITGEGRIDSQTIHGKVPIGVANIAKRYNKPVIGIAGSLTADVSVVHEHGLDAVFSVIYTICTLEDALKNASENVRMTARNVAATLKAGQQLR